MAFLEWTLYQNTVADWLLALVVGFAVFTLWWLVRWQLVERLTRLAQRTEYETSDMLLAVLGRTRTFFLMALALRAATHMLVLAPTLETVIRWLVVLAIVLQIGIWGSGAIHYYVTRQVRRQLESDAAAATTVNALGFLARLILWSVLFLAALDNFGIDITALVAGLGIGGIAIALAVQNILGDLFASLSIVLDKPFVIGDFIIVGDLLGTVEYIGLKTTRIRALSGEQIVFSNSDLLNSRIRNFKRMYQRRVVAEFGVVYQTGYDELVEIPRIVREAVEALPDTRFDRAHFREYGDSSLIFEYVYHVLVPDFNTYMDRQQAINLAIFRVFRERGIDFAYPTRTLYLQEAAADDALRAAPQAR
jgi:small-conductance mechanosensitive channel